MTRRCHLLLRAFASDANLPTAAAVNSPAQTHTSTPHKSPPQLSRRSPLLDTTASGGEIETLRKELAMAQLRISELRLSQTTLCEALLRRMDETDRAAHKTATELRYTALALQCHHDLLETELRRILAIKPQGGEMCEEDVVRLRAAAIEAASREMVRKNIGFRVEKVADEPAPSLRVNENVDCNSDNMKKNKM